MSIEFEAIKALMPKGPNWEGVEEGIMGEMLEGISTQVERDSEYSEKISNNYLPFGVELLSEQEELFRLPTTGLTDEERLKRIQGAWSNLSPSTFTGFNKLLALSGFDDIIARPLAEGEIPTDILDYYTLYVNGVNGVIINDTYTALGRAILGADSGTSNLGKYIGSAEYFPTLSIPTNEAQWGMIFVIEGIDGEVAEISDDLKSSFDFLIYKMKPLFMMGISRVKTVSEVLFRCNFTSDVTTGQTEVLASFTPILSGGTAPYTYSWKKSYNSGVYIEFSTESNPIELFDELGSYSISLDVTDTNGLTSSYVQEDYINVIEFEADFVGTPTSGDLPLEVDFTNLTICSEEYTYLWEVSNDGTNWITAGTQCDLNYIFNFEGLYSIRLTITNGSYTATETKENYIKAGDTMIVEQDNFEVTSLLQDVDYDITITHTLNTLFITGVSVLNNDNEEINTDFEVVDSDTVLVKYLDAIVGTHKVMIQGIRNYEV